MNKFKFEKLIIWQDVMDFGEVINVVSQEFPDKEKFNSIIKLLDSENNAEKYLAASGWEVGKHQ